MTGGNMWRGQLLGYQWVSTSLADDTIDTYVSEVYPTQYEAVCGFDSDMLETLGLDDSCDDAVNHVEMDDANHGEQSLWAIYNPPHRGMGCPRVLIRWEVFPVYAKEVTSHGTG